MRNVKIPWLSAAVLVIVNLSQLLGVFFFKWDFFYIFFVYWPEIFIILFFSKLKVRMVRKLGGSVVGAKEGFDIMGIAILGSMPWSLGILNYLILELKMPFYKVLWSSLLLFISHWFSYIINFLGGKEFISVPVQQMMNNSIKRCIVILSTLTFGAIVLFGFGCDFLHPPKIALATIILIKIILDLLFHIAEHNKNGQLSA